MTALKLIVAGGRDFTDKALLLATLEDICSHEPVASRGVEIVSGMARGADRLGWELAKEYGVTCHEFPANWDKYGKSAGYRRNAEMAAFADGLLAFWDGVSRGTANMIQTMEKLGKPVRVINY